MKKTRSSRSSKKDKLSEEERAFRREMKQKAKKLACPNKKCEMFNLKWKGNVIFHQKYGSGATQNLFRCRKCNCTFSERKGTPLFGLRLPEEKIWSIIRCLVEGNGTRATARIVNVHRDTVTKIIRRLGEHSKEVSEFFLQEYPLKECQLDELWTFIKKNKKN